MINIIGFTLRSGSSHLCELMRSVKVFGFPFEHYSPVEFSERMEKRKSIAQNPMAYFLEILGNSQGGLCCVKTNWDSFAKFIEETQPLFHHLDIRYVYLTRRDQVAQAVSWVIADQSDVWSSYDRQTKRNLEYDAEAIGNRLQIIKIHEERWEAWFRNGKIDPLRLFYENIEIDTVHQIGEFLKVSTEGTQPKSEFTRQANDINRQWIERFQK